MSRNLLQAPEALADLLSALAAGDPVAWIGFGGFLGLAGLLGLFVLKTNRDLDREDAQRTRRYGRSK